MFIIYNMKLVYEDWSWSRGRVEVYPRGVAGFRREVRLVRGCEPHNTLLGVQV